MLLAFYSIFKLKPSEDIFNGLNKLENIVMLSKFQNKKSYIGNSFNFNYSTYDIGINANDSCVET
jgi:hypothetical protein